ncbi:MAG: helix-turn-helix domain-containing protein [Nanoarchaeota archaeon]|nr:helix-turn-helix domain-containing protein [Nanoarchaeota archaeon]
MDEKIKKSLEELGLEKEEAEIYYILVLFGSATIGKVSTISKLSRTKIYSVFDKLLSKKWVRIASDKPKTFAPVDPAQRLQDKKTSMLSAYDIAKKELCLLSKRSKSILGEALVYRGVDVLKKVENMLLNAKKKVGIVSAFLPEEYVDKLIIGLEGAKARGVDVQIVVGKHLENDPLLEKLKESFCVKIRDTPNAGVILVDGNEALLGSRISEDKPEIEGLFAIGLKDEGLVKLLGVLVGEGYKDLKIEYMLKEHDLRSAGNKNVINAISKTGGLRNA